MQREKKMLTAKERKTVESKVGLHILLHGKSKNQIIVGDLVTLQTSAGLYKTNPKNKLKFLLTVRHFQEEEKNFGAVCFLVLSKNLQDDKHGLYAVLINKHQPLKGRSFFLFFLCSPDTELKVYNENCLHFYLKFSLGIS